MTWEPFAIGGLSIGVLVTIVFALHNVVQQQIKNLQDLSKAESDRLKEDSNKTERRLDDATMKAENRLRDETLKTEVRFAASLQEVEKRNQEKLDSVDLRISIEFKAMCERLEKEMNLQFKEVHSILQRISEETGDSKEEEDQ